MAMSMDLYPAYFRACITRSVQVALARVQACATQLSDDARERSLHALTFALKLTDLWSITSPLLLALAPKMEREGYRGLWLPFLEEGIKQCQCHNDDAVEAELKFQLGLIYERLSQFDLARLWLTSSATSFAAVSDPENQARSLNWLAYIARQQAQYTEANRLVETALALAGQSHRIRASSYSVLGSIAFDRQDWEQAVTCFRQSLHLWEKLGNTRLIAWSLRDLGPPLHALGRVPEALSVYTRALTLFATYPDPVYEAATRMNLGILHLTTGEPAKALELFSWAEPIFRQVQDQVHLAKLYINQGLAYRNLTPKTLDNALEAFQCSIEKWRELGNSSELINALDELGLTYLECGEYQQALHTFSLALNELSQIENHPMYQPHWAIVTKHLDETRKRLEMEQI